MQFPERKSGLNKGLAKSFFSFNDSLDKAPDDLVTGSIEIARMHLFEPFNLSLVDIDLHFIAMIILDPFNLDLMLN